MYGRDGGRSWFLLYMAWHRMAERRNPEMIYYIEHGDVVVFVVHVKWRYYLCAMLFWCCSIFRWSGQVVIICPCHVCMYVASAR